MASTRPAKPSHLRRLVFICAVVMLGSSMAGPARGQSSASMPQVVRESRFEIADAPAVAEVVQQVVNFPPGAWTSPHSHGGQAINLVMEGEITFRWGDLDGKYPEGEAWSDPTGEVHSAGNETEAPSHLLTNFLLPAGATQTTVQGESKLEPRVTYQARFPVTSLPAGADVLQQAADFEPGAWSGPVKHGGQAVHIVVFGEITYRAKGHAKVYKPGEAWQDAAGHAYDVGNMGSETARLFTTVLLPEGAEVTEEVSASGLTSAEPPEQENTGSGTTFLTLVVAAGALALIGMGLLLFRRSSTSA